MPIAGSNVECVPMQVVGNQLIEHAKQRIPSHMAQGPSVALEMLEQGEMAYVRMLGRNVALVRAACAENGVEVSE